MERRRLFRADANVTLAERLAAALAAPHDARLLVGDHRDLPDTLADAAVLIAVTDRAEPGVILTQRTEHLRRHAGQVAFPGGRIDPGDGIGTAGAIAAALREANEEVAMPPAAVTVIDTADEYRTGTGFAITPVIGVVPPDLPLVAAEAEVAAVFEVPFAFALDPANHLEASAEWQGQRRRYFEINWGGRRIWGATAGIIVNLSRRLQWR